MNGQYPTNIFYDFLSAPALRVPANVQAIIEESFAQAQSSYGAATAHTKKNMEALEEVFSASQKEAKAIGEKVLRNTETNAEAFFETANALARAKSLPEFMRLQSDYIQKQMRTADIQGKELFALSTRVAQQTFDGISSVIARGLEIKKTA